MSLFSVIIFFICHYFLYLIWELIQLSLFVSKLFEFCFISQFPFIMQRTTGPIGPRRSRSWHTRSPTSQGRTFLSLQCGSATRAGRSSWSSRRRCLRSVLEQRRLQSRLEQSGSQLLLIRKQKWDLKMTRDTHSRWFDGCRCEQRD